MNVENVTMKLERRHIQRLRDRARATGRSQAALVRELIDRHLGETTPSLHDRAHDLCGSVAGGKDMSTRPLRGFGRD
jgi:hypothetical protein